MEQPPLAMMLSSAEPADFEAFPVKGNGMLPYYRHGDVLLVSRRASLRMGDRVILKTTAGQIFGGIFLRKDDQTVHLTTGFARQFDVSQNVNEVDFLGRIMWASQ